MTAILVSRFLLDLQSVYQQSYESDETQSTGTLIFDRVVGSFSGSISFDSDTQSGLDAGDGYDKSKFNLEMEEATAEWSELPASLPTHSPSCPNATDIHGIGETKDYGIGIEEVVSR